MSSNNANQLSSHELRRQRVMMRSNERLKLVSGQVRSVNSHNELQSASQPPDTTPIFNDIENIDESRPNSSSVQPTTIESPQNDHNGSSGDDSDIIDFTTPAARGLLKSHNGKPPQTQEEMMMQMMQMMMGGRSPPQSQQDDPMAAIAAMFGQMGIGSRPSTADSHTLAYQKQVIKTQKQSEVIYFSLFVIFIALLFIPFKQNVIHTAFFQSPMSTILFVSVLLNFARCGIFHIMKPIDPTQQNQSLQSSFTPPGLQQINAMFSRATGPLGQIMNVFSFLQRVVLTGSLLLTFTLVIGMVEYFIFPGTISSN